MKVQVQELHKAVLIALCQTLSDSATMVKYVEDDDHIEGVFILEHSTSYGSLRDLSAILWRYGFVIGKIDFGEPAEIQVTSWDCRFKTAVAKVCSIFGIYEDDNQMIRVENVEAVGRIIGCAMKHNIIPTD